MGHMIAFGIIAIIGGFTQIVGMTLRDWFAGRFMQAMAPSMMEAGRLEGEDPGDVAIVIAGTAYLMADTMLAARKECRP